MMLIEAKDNGGLVKPSRSVVMICKVTETIVRHSAAVGISEVNMKRIKHMAFQKCLPLDVYSCLHYSNRFSFDPFSNNHNTSLIKFIIKEYAKIRLHHLTKEWSRNQKRTSVRQRNNKLTIFQGMWVLYCKSHIVLYALALSSVFICNYLYKLWKYF